MYRAMETWINQTFNDIYVIETEHGDRTVVHHSPEATLAQFAQMLVQIVPNIHLAEKYQANESQFILLDKDEQRIIAIVWPWDNRIIHTSLLKEDN